MKKNKFQKLWDTRVINLFFNNPGLSIWKEYFTFCDKYKIERANGLLRTPQDRFFSVKTDIYTYVCQCLPTVYAVIEKRTFEDIFQIIDALQLSNVDTIIEHRGNMIDKREKRKHYNTERKSILEMKLQMDFKEMSNESVSRAGIKHIAGKIR